MSLTDETSGAWSPLASADGGAPMSANVHNKTVTAGADSREESGAAMSAPTPAVTPSLLPSSAGVEQPATETDPPPVSVAMISLPRLRVDDPDPSWRERANCRSVKTSIFFETQINSSSEVVRQLRAVCGACEVRERCLQFALDNDERGWWGGLGQNERRRLRAPRPLGPFVHGTPHGIKKHERRGEPPCDECRNARIVYYRDRKVSAS